MKKNKMMRIASVLLVAVLLSTCAISGTFAKYVTSAENSDEAIVAKWGVKISLDPEMFSDSYKDEATTYNINDTDATITVQADTAGTNLVAPGTKGTLADFVVTGKPEVDVTVTYDATLTLNGWKVVGDWDNDPNNNLTEVVYCPIMITVNDKTFSLDGVKDSEGNIADNVYGNIDALEAGVKEAIAAATQTYDTNTDLSTTVHDDLEVSWEWAFDENDDVKDTLLGDAAALVPANAASIKLEVKMTITQVD